MEKIYFIDINSLFPTLFWGNAISLVFLIIYRQRSRLLKEQHLTLFLIIARLCHMIYYLVASGRDILPDWLSVNIGNTLLLVGFFFEAQAILRVINESSPFTDRLLRVILIITIIIFNAVEFIFPLGGIRITTASIGVVAIMALPVFRMLVSRDSSAFTKSTAMLYCIFLLLLLGRAVYGLQNQNAGILASNILHSVTFLTQLLQLIISLPAYALILKNYADEALLLMATTDRVTGATNRHAFLEAAAAIYRNCKRYRIPFAVLFLDIDYFKRVNDSYGHAFGDTVLARLASIIDKCLRESDLSCRYGGEEFVVLLSRSDKETAERVAQRIMDEVNQAHFEEHPKLKFTVSIGVASGLSLLDRGFEAAIQSADEAMYRAKRAGRGRIEVFEL